VFDPAGCCSGKSNSVFEARPYLALPAVGFGLPSRAWFVPWYLGKTGTPALHPTAVCANLGKSSRGSLLNCSRGCGGMSTLGQCVSTSDAFTGHLCLADFVGPEGTIT
jgi:hypothetical protein